MSEFPTSILVLLLAASLDYLIGDPRGWLHPVQVMGWGISSYNYLVINRWHSHLVRRLAGIGLGVGAILGSGLVGWLILQAASGIHPWFGVGIEAILLASCFAARSLQAAAIDVLQPLSAGDVEEARSRLSQYVGRDTENLSPEDIHRAIVETIAENTTDGVTAPLFYALIGAFIPGVGSLPLALAYKAASTLDSMVGYQREPFTDLGWFSAQVEDFLTLVPCRLTVLTLSLMSGAPQQTWHLCRRDAIKDPSPNAGWSECAFAAILDVQLGGTNRYGGVVKHKPLLGEPTHPITSAQVHQALGLTRNCFLIWLGIGLVGLLLEKLV
ncbi:MAG: cobalamin biosynthesis protein [Cyanobacteria bacterium QS_7_48_42]|nr:MAG: cobalamin biosynthesis protein [Cyanobacteria bacterium QH_1_48_107]PSO55501.1 MAG: cobalamin biosynthesis protein [Cyanobacteria bacterium QH_10_48_56]PSO56340.1 MAG: cobalamin biosynthesis protein [Cyanobacteria bacterium QH_7_48_89]PSO63648.1 MAG: cobalamin biosynthesis protein [Cyanobacteria bacterium QH_6_48_35]PSO75027.1 MAG: cobalamin biosynthesis protein [Cyanobacteria bacterium QH_3_48_40]PSO87395.1 MAG: cobalamin biosynthesis protein [Cyanobacteria bacterium QS_5_48_63]PSO89